MLDISSVSEAWRALEDEMMSERLIGSLLNRDTNRASEKRSKGDDAFQDAVKETRERIADAFTKGHPIPARRKAC